MNTDCNHSWEVGCGFDSRPCIYCKGYQDRNVRCKCKHCHIEAFIMCVESKFKITFSKSIAMTNFSYDQIIVLEKRVRVGLRSKSCLIRKTNTIQ